MNLTQWKAIRILVFIWFAFVVVVTTLWATTKLHNVTIQLGTTGTTLTGTQGNSGIVQQAGTIAGTAAPVCTDANGNTTTSGCLTGNLSFTRKALAGNVGPISSNTVTTIDFITINSWPAGCGVNGCRVRVYYSYALTNGNNTGQCYVADGTNTYAESATNTQGSNAFCSSSAISPTQFSSSSGSVTFTATIFNTGSPTINATSALGTAVPSYLEVEIIQSN